MPAIHPSILSACLINLQHLPGIPLVLVVQLGLSLLQDPLIPLVHMDQHHPELQKLK